MKASNLGALFSLVLSIGSAQAAIIHLEVSGNLAYGTDQTNVFGLGLNQNLAGKNAIFSWDIDSTKLGADRDVSPTASMFGCGPSLPGCTYFMGANVTINGVTRSLLGGAYGMTNSVQMYADTDGSGLASADQFFLRMGQSQDIGGWYKDASGQWYQATRQINSKVEIGAQDKVQSILNGLDPAELHAWSTNLLTGANDSGSVVFNFSNTGVNGQNVTEFSTGVLLLSDSSVKWWTGANANTGNSVPEPGTIALLGLGLAAFGFSRQRKIKNLV